MWLIFHRNFKRGVGSLDNFLGACPLWPGIADPLYSQLLSVILMWANLYASTITAMGSVYNSVFTPPPMLWMTSSSHHQIRMKLMGYYFNYLLLVSTKRGIQKPGPVFMVSIKSNSIYLYYWGGIQHLRAVKKVSVWSILILFSSSNYVEHLVINVAQALNVRVIESISNYAQCLIKTLLLKEEKENTHMPSYWGIFFVC